jgi:hypothetical protein
MSKAYNALFHDTNSFKKKTVIPNVRVTPDFAQELLQHNRNNRPISQKTVKEYAKRMKANEWEFNGDNIRFSEDGILMDGQHKLMAVVDSNTVQVFNIQTGLKPDVFDVIDIGKGRTASDAVAVAGYDNHGTLSAMIKLVMSYYQNEMKNNAYGGKRCKTYSPADVINYMQNGLNVELAQECSTFGNKCMYKSRFYSGPTYAAFCYIFSKIDREQAFFFFELLSSGENISKNAYSMIYMLRQKLINQQLKNTRLNTVDKYALLIKSWNYFRKGREVDKLSWQPNEDFPKAI